MKKRMIVVCSSPKKECYAPSSGYDSPEKAWEAFNIQVEHLTNSGQEIHWKMKPMVIHHDVDGKEVCNIVAAC